MRSSVRYEMPDRLERDFERFKREQPGDLAGYVRETYRIDLAARYLGYSLPHPIGKASGQLSLNLEQIEADTTAFIDDAVAFAEESPSPAPEDALLHVFWEGA